MLCLGIVSFMLLMLVVHGASWVCELMVFIKFRKFLAIISLNIFSAISHFGDSKYAY